MVLEIIIQNENLTKLNTIFSKEQLEILEDEYSKKLVLDELSSLDDVYMIDEYRKKYHISKRDVIDMIVENE